MQSLPTALGGAARCLPFVVLATFACSSSDDSDNEQVRLAWVSKGKCNSFFDISAYGARSAGMELEEESSGAVVVELLEPDDCSEQPVVPEGLSEACQSAGPQIARVQEALERNFSALAISVSSPDCLTPLLDEAVDRGMKVITFDSDAPDSKRHAYYGMDNRLASRFLVDRLSDMLGGEGKVAIQTSMKKDDNGVYQLSQSTSYTERMAGIADELAEHDGLTLVATLPCEGNDPLDPMCAGEVEALLEQHPDLEGLILSRGKVLREVGLEQHAPAYAAKIQSGGLRVVAFDAPEDALDNISAGYADLVIAQKQFAWGYEVVHLTHDYLTGEVELPSFYDSGWHLVCGENVEAYSVMWEERDFRGALAQCPGGS